MILKNADDKTAHIDELNRLISIAPSKGVKSKIEAKLRMVRAGIKGERDTSFHLDDYFKDSKNVYIIHDLRLEHNGRIVQIDHLLINRLLDVYVLETKQLHAGMKISESGEFVQWNNYKKKFEGMASPLAQNARHVDVLKSIFSGAMEMPTRLGLALMPSFHSRILVNATARIDRPEKFDTSEIVKADDFYQVYKKAFDEISFKDVVSGLVRLVSPEQADFISRKLMNMHQPIMPNYAAEFGLADEAAPPEPAEAVITQTPEENNHVVAQDQAAYQVHICSKCNSDDLAIAHGKFGYYFKCRACNGNTSIQLDCGVKGHKERISKKGNQFFRTCADCDTRALFFEN